MSMSCGGSRRGGDRGDHPQVGPDGWTATGSSIKPRPGKAGDLSNFGKIIKGQPMTFGPGSVLARGPNASDRFSMLNMETVEPTVKRVYYILCNCKTLPSSLAAEQGKRLVLQPRSNPVETEPAEAASPDAGSPVKQKKRRRQKRNSLATQGRPGG
jgi:translation initiation factor 4G